MFRTTGAILVAAGLLGCGCWNSNAEEAPQAPTQELINYVKDARRLGLPDDQIKQGAVKAGWPGGAVEQALSQPQTAAPERAGSAKDNSEPELAGKDAPAPASAEKAAPAAAAPRAEGKDLLQYVKDAKALGLRDEQIRKNAINAGWQAEAVDQAIAATGAASPKPEGPAPSRERGVPDDYRIGAGDVLHISVWKEPDASVPSVVVRPDGKIAMPLLKEVEVVGLTPREAEKLITDGLSKFISGADVTVVVSAINSKKIYLIGAVKREGPLPYTYRMSIMQAISEVGGLTDYAKRKKIYVLRHENGNDYRLPFNYDEVLKGVRMEQNIPLLPNDTIVVPH